MTVTGADVYLADTPPACATSGLPASTWDPNVHGETAREKRDRLAAATNVCVICPLLQPCTELGKANNELGVWGFWFADDERTRPLRYPAGIGLSGWARR